MTSNRAEALFLTLIMLVVGVGGHREYGFVWGLLLMLSVGLMWIVTLYLRAEEMEELE